MRISNVSGNDCHWILRGQFSVAFSTVSAHIIPHPNALPMSVQNPKIEKIPFEAG